MSKKMLLYGPQNVMVKVNGFFFSNLNILLGIIWLFVLYFDQDIKRTKVQSGKTKSLNKIKYLWI